MTDIRTVGVAGSGTMGAGIAIVAARAGFRTIVYDTKAEALARARKQTEGFFAKSVERGKLDRRPAVARRADCHLASRPQRPCDASDFKELFAGESQR